MTDATASTEISSGDAILLEAGTLICLPWDLPAGLRRIDAPCGSPREWDALIAHERVTLVCVWPSTLARWLADGQDLPATLKTVCCGGETLPRAVAEAFARQASAALVHTHTPENAHGPLLAWRVEAGGLRGEVVPAGRPLAPERVRVNDASGRPAPVGTVGRLHVRDAHDVWRPTLDFARCTRQGLIELTGRADGSILLRGQRVDINSVLQTLLAMPSVADAHVALRLRADTGAGLVAWVVPRQGAEIALPPDSWDTFAGSVRPQTVLFVNSLPLSRAGDIDEAALDALGAPDDNAANFWEQQLRQTPGVRAAAVLVRPQPPAERAVWQLSRKVELPTAGVDPAPDVAAMVPAIEIHGPPLPSLCWPSLGAALIDCAAAEPTHGVRFLTAHGDHFIAYSELLDAALRTLGGLRADGAKVEDPILLLLADQKSFLISFWACILGGFVPVPISPPPVWDPDHAAAQKIINVWTLLGQARVLTGESDVEHLSLLGLPFNVSIAERCALAPREASWHPAHPDDIALMLLTSGSTGTPKAVMQSHRTVLSRCEMTRMHRQFDRHTVSLNWLPLDHVGAVVMFHVRDITLHCQQLHAPTDLFITDPLRWLDWMDRWKVSVTWAPNFAFGLINARASEMNTRQWNLSSVTCIINAGEAIVPATARRFLALLAPHGLPDTAMCPEWGMSETCSAVVASSTFTLASTHDTDAFAELGPPLAGTSLRIQDAQPSRAGTPPVGRLQVRGPSVTPGYYRNEAAMRETFTDDGWFDTGDLGFIRDGCLTLTGRGKDCVIVNGVNLYSHEVEAIVDTVPGVDVSYTAVCAYRPAGADTDEMVIFFVAESGTDARKLGQHIRAEVGRRLGVNPRHLVPLTAQEVPKTAIGKIQRAQLQNRFRAGDFSARVLDGRIQSDLKEGLPDCLATVRWMRAETTSRTSLSGRWLLVGASEATRTRYSHALLANGATIVGNVDAVGTLKPAFLQKIDHLLWLELEGGAGDETATAVEKTLHALEALAHHLRTHRDESHALEWVALTRGVAPIHRDPLNLAHAPVAAWLSSLSAEHPWLRTRVIDLDIQPYTNEMTSIGRILLGTGDDAPQVAWRRGKRWVPRIARVTPSATEGQPWHFEHGSTWLLAGGLGGIGLAMAKRLGIEYGVRWLIVGRRHATQPDVTTALGQLREAGVAVEYLCCDISDSSSLRLQVLAALGTNTLAGVIQAAASGSLAAQWEGNGLANPEAAAINQQFTAKVAGSLALAALMEACPGSIFVGFSSVTATFGAATLAGYAAANAFLSALCIELQRRGHIATAFEWSMWEGLGLAAGAPDAARDRTRAQGYDVLALRQGVDGLLLGSAIGLPHLIVGIRPQHPSWRARGAGESRLLCGLSGYVVAAPDLVLPIPVRNGKALSSNVTLLPTLPTQDNGEIDREALASLQGSTVNAGQQAARPETEWQHRVHTVWCELLGQTAISIHDNFFEIGGHSMLLTRARARLSALAGRELPMVDLFRQSTIARLANYLEQGEPEAVSPATPPQTPNQRQQAMLEQQRRRGARAPAPQR